MAQEVEKYSSAALAFLGDSVFEVNIRRSIVETCKKDAGELNKKTKALTNAKAQSEIAGFLLEHLSEEEIAVYKRGRNMKSVNAPKSCSISEYRRATGLEALYGYLFVTENIKRIDELTEMIISFMEEKYGKAE